MPVPSKCSDDLDGSQIEYIYAYYIPLWALDSQCIEILIRLDMFLGVLFTGSSQLCIVFFKIIIYNNQEYLSTFTGYPISK